MEAFGINRLLHRASIAVLSSLAVSSVACPLAVSAQDLPTGPNQARPIDPNDPNVISPTNNADTGILSLTEGNRLMADANRAIAAQDYGTAVKKLQDARQIFNQLSNFHQQLAGIFSGIENRISESRRQQALETAQLRDEATYELALTHRAQRQPELAVPLLVQIIGSQQPTRELGQKAYQQLFELGFAEFPYPRPKEAEGAGPEAATPPNPADTGILNPVVGEQLMGEANRAVGAQDYRTAVKKLQEARQIFNQLSNFHQQLAGYFSGVESAIADNHRRKALDTAQSRDEATYQLALVHRAQRQPELSVPLLVQIVASQQPTRELGKKAYQQLFELGFADSPYPRPRSDSSSSSSSSSLR